jgi:hypothetical protein
MLLAKKITQEKKIVPLAILSALLLSLCAISHAMTDEQYLDVYFGMAKKFYGGDQTVKAPFLDVIRHYLKHGDVNEGMNEVGKYSGKTIGQIIQEQTKSCPSQKSIHGIDCCWGTNTGTDCYENRCANGVMSVYGCNAGKCVATQTPCPSGSCDTTEIAQYGHSHKCA